MFHVCGTALAIIAVVLAALPGHASAASPPEVPGLSPQERQAVALVNQYRADHGLRPLRLRSPLMEVAGWMSRDMARNDRFSHEDSAGRDPFERMTAMGYGAGRWRGENLAAGNADAVNTVRQWRESPTHDANLLTAEYSMVGIAREPGVGRYDWYWSLEFGSAPVAR